MKRNKREHLNLKLGWYLIAGSSLIFIPCPGMLAQSNIVPDNTLGKEASVVNPAPDNVLTELISGGAQRGQNLFHSFQEFNVGEGKGAYFVSPNADIANILSRVTGSNPSKIMGTLGTMGAAQPNLFLINPNGIIFGENASLDVGSSFVATTADRIQFGDRGFFSASEPDVPPLLTVQPSAFFFNQMNGSIQNNSVAPAGLDPTESLEFFGLRVPDGESLLLLGGDVEINSGGIVALDGEINIGAVETGTVELNKVNNNLSLSLTENLLRGNISLTNGAGLLTSGKNGGKIAIAAENIDILANSTVETGILSNLGSMEAQANDIELDATKAIAVDNSFVFNRVSDNATGNGGNLFIDTKNLSISNNARVSTNTFGQGNAGSINLQTQVLNITEGAQLTSSTFGQGDAGNLSIIANDVEINGGENGIFTALTASVGPEAKGKGGNITIGSEQLPVEQLMVTNGARILASIFGQGDGGNITINASELVKLDGGDSDISTGIFFQVLETGKGNSGNLTLNTRQFSISNGAQISASIVGESQGGDLTVNSLESVEIKKRSGLFADTIGSGDAGKLTITTGKLLVEEGLVGAGTFGSGQGGTIAVNASESVELIGTFGEDTPGGLTTQAQSIGDAGDLIVETKQLIVRDGASIKASAVLGSGDGGDLTINTEDLFIENAQISASTFSEGNAGKLEIIASESIEIIGTNKGLEKAPSGIFAQTNPESSGISGSLTIETKRLSARDGGQVSVTSLGTGDSGNLKIRASELLELSGITPNGELSSGIFADTQLAGNAGDLNVTTEQLIVRDGAEISANSKGEGSGGNLFLEANSLTLNNRASIVASTESGEGGNITFQIDDNLILQNTSLISARAANNANGGNINMEAEFIIAFPNQNNDIIANAQRGNGGNINITAESIFGLAERSSTPPNLTNDIDASSEFGLDGNISINTPDIDPASALENLPTDIVDASRLITRNCLGGGDSEELNEFVVTGRGGLPSNPNEYLPGDATLSADWVSLPDTSGESPTRVSMPNKSIVSQARNHIVEAKGWLVKPDGTVILTAEANIDRHVTSGFIPPACNN